MMPYTNLSCKPLLKIILILFLTAGIFEPSAVINHKEGDVVMAQGNIEEEYKPAALRVMTFNIRHGKGLDDEVNLARIIEEIELTGADVIGLQEVDRHNPRSGFKDQVKELGEALGMYWVFSPSLNYGWMQYGNALLSRYPITASEVTVLPSENELRTVLQADILLGHDIIQVVNTHLGLSTLERQKQMQLLMEILRDASIPTVVMGDFNMEIDHSLMEDLKKGWKKVETGKPTLLSGQEVDHIFFNMPVNSLTAWTQPTMASDHHPVIADIDWQR
jgi:endonuclease/exonuclease/phosphatase family metal-dependent hydrolase